MKIHNAKQDVRLPTKKQRVQTSKTTVSSSGQILAVTDDLNRPARCKFIYWLDVFRMYLQN